MNSLLERAEKNEWDVECPLLDAINPPFIDFVSTLSDKIIKCSEGWDAAIEDNKLTIIDATTTALAGMLGVEYDTVAYEELESLVSTFVNDYLDDRFDKKTALEDLMSSGSAMSFFSKISFRIGQQSASVK